MVLYVSMKFLEVAGLGGGRGWCGNSDPCRGLMSPPLGPTLRPHPPPTNSAPKRPKTPPPGPPQGWGGRWWVVVLSLFGWGLCRRCPLLGSGLCQRCPLQGSGLCRALPAQPRAAKRCPPSLTPLLRGRRRPRTPSAGEAPASWGCTKNRRGRVQSLQFTLPLPLPLSPPKL